MRLETTGKAKRRPRLPRLPNPVPSADWLEAARLKKLFDASSKAARIGVWECSLPDEKLTWTEMVYHLFDLPVGAALSRDTTLAFYVEEHRQALNRLRSRAIEERGGFSLDVQIVTAAGNHRWLRITATVECADGVPIRIFGLKQDVTAEKILIEEIRQLAEFDTLTAVPNRFQFERRLSEACAGPLGLTPKALFLIDLDGFKDVNDTFGHQEGDKCLQEAARRLSQALPEGFIARIGGDEFAALIDCASPDAARDVGRRIVEALSWAYGTDSVKLKVGASVGIAWDLAGVTPKDIFAEADKALYTAKAEGKNCLRLARRLSAGASSISIDAA